VAWALVRQLIPNGEPVMLANFLKFLALVCIFNVFCLAAAGTYMHRWMPFRILCFIVASVSLAGFAAIVAS
jgi:hypothetical protein